MMKLTSTLCFCASLTAFVEPGNAQLRAGGDGADGARNFDVPGSNETASDSDPLYLSGDCNCGAGHCDQRGCGQGASCGAGHCNQEGLFGPTCGAGHCNQRNTVNPTCGAGHCNQENAVNPTCGAGWCCQQNATNPSCNAGHCNCMMKCIGGDTLLFSCTADDVIAARDVSIGDQVRAVNAETGESVCSDVYYKFSHEESDVAVRITTVGEDGFTVSYDHIVYVGETFGDRRPVLAQNLEPGDELVSSSNGRSVEVLEVETVAADLVNVLTMDPQLEIQSANRATDGADDVSGGIVISAHSVDEEAYAAVFAPIRYAYAAFGARVVEYMTPLFNAADYLFAGTGIKFVKMMSADEE